MAGKKIKGRKIHIVVDSMGNLLAITVHAANSHDTKSGIISAGKAFEIAASEQLGLEVDIS